MATSLQLSAVQGLNCQNRTGGVKELYIIPTSDVESITLGTTEHDITNIVFVTAGNGFGKINFKRGEAEVTESMEQENEVVVNFAVPNPTAAQRKQLNDIRKNCESYVVARLYDSDILLFIGYDGVALDEAFSTFQSLESTSGRAKTDANLFNFNLVASQGEIVRVLTGISGASATTTDTIVAELLAATSV